MTLNRMIYEPDIAEATIKSMRRHIMVSYTRVSGILLFYEKMPDTEKMMTGSTLKQTCRAIYFAPGKGEFEPVAIILGDEKPPLSVSQMNDHQLGYRISTKSN